jgi:hypothetical protein
MKFEERKKLALLLSISLFACSLSYAQGSGQRKPTNSDLPPKNWSI